MTSILALAARMRAMDDEALVSALAARSVNTEGIRDFFDLADALLHPEAVQDALSRLDRHTLALLYRLADPAVVMPGAAGSEQAGFARAHDLLLVEHDGTRNRVYNEVAAQLKRWPAIGLPGALELHEERADAPQAGHPDHELIDRIAAERAFATTSAVAELVFELEREPARLLARGGIGLPEARRLAEATSLGPDDIPALLDLAGGAGLVSTASGHLHAADGSGQWLDRLPEARWVQLGEAWLAGLPIGIRTLLSERGDAPWGEDLRSWLHWLYPAGGQWLRDRVQVRLAETELLGITAREWVSGPGTLLLRGDPDAGAAAMATLLPTPVHRLYLQHDLSLVAPGPLVPALDARLRTMADKEGSALASSYRISTSSINRGLAAGESAESMLAFLESVSLTGIPQPLRYLVTETSGRFGALRVGELAEEEGHASAISYVRSEDPELLGTVLVDQNLVALRLQASGRYRALSRSDRGQVFWALSEARYPVAAEDASGNIVTLRRRRPARQAPAAVPQPLVTLVQRLRQADEGTPEDTGQAWLARQLEAAIRSKATLAVSVRIPSGVVVDFHLQPTSIAGGRLRARDHSSGVERTLPLSSIARVAESPA